MSVNRMPGSTEYQPAGAPPLPDGVEVVPPPGRLVGDELAGVFALCAVVPPVQPATAREKTQMNEVAATSHTCMRRTGDTSS